MPKYLVGVNETYTYHLSLIIEAHNIQQARKHAKDGAFSEADVVEKWQGEVDKREVSSILKWEDD